MQRTVELPTIEVVAYPKFSSSPSVGTPQYSNNSFPPAMQFAQIHGAEIVFSNGHLMFAAANKNKLEEAFLAFLSGLNGLNAPQLAQQLAYHARVQRELSYIGKINSYPDNAQLKLTSSIATEAVYSRTWFMTQDTPERAVDYDFYGTPIMAATGLYYWLFGDGQDRNVHISSLDLKINVGDIKPIANAINIQGPGTYQINEGFSINTFDHAENWGTAGLLGRIGGTISGQLSIGADNSYSFNGNYSLGSDFYNADLSNRTWLQESATDFLRFLGDTFGHKDYTINVIGSQPIQFSGHK
jgi:hypothetical protein